MDRQVESIMVNCRQIDTQYRAPATLAIHCLKTLSEMKFRSPLQPTAPSTNLFVEWTDVAECLSSSLTKLTIWCERPAMICCTI